MTPPDQIVLEERSTPAALMILKEARQAWAAEIASGYPEMVQKLVAVVIEEVARNTLHGDYATVKRLPLPDDSVLIIATDIAGTDHLEKTGVPIGLAMIEGIVGEGNFLFQHNASIFEQYVRIDPSSIAARLP